MKRLESALAPINDISLGTSTSAAVGNEIMDDKLVLWDMPSREGKAYSPNAWKTRLVLNYKNILYETKWVFCKDIESTVKATGTEPSPPNMAGVSYTLPFVQFSGGRQQMDSLKIAPILEQLKPDPSLHLDSELHVEAQNAMDAVFTPILKYILIRTPQHVYCPEDIDWFYKMRAKRFNIAADSVQSEEEDDAAWNAAQPAFRRVAALLTSHKREEGPFILGQTPSYGDLIIVAYARFARACGEEAWNRFIGQEESIRALYSACGKWLERDDH